MTLGAPVSNNSINGHSMQADRGSFKSGSQGEDQAAASSGHSHGLPKSDTQFEHPMNLDEVTLRV